MVPSTNRSGHRPFKAEMPGSNPAGITIYRIGVKAARLTLTQAVVVQIHDPVPYGSMAKLVKAADCKSVIARSNRAGTSSMQDDISRR